MLAVSCIVLLLFDVGYTLRTIESFFSRVRDYSGREVRSTLDFKILMSLRCKSLRNRKWFRLSSVERALFHCAIWVAKARGNVTSMNLLLALSKIILKLNATGRAYIMKVGSARAKEILSLLNENGVFRWAPEAKGWFCDSSFIFYIGVASLSRR